MRQAKQGIKIQGKQQRPGEIYGKAEEEGGEERRVVECMMGVNEEEEEKTGLSCGGLFQQERDDSEDDVTSSVSNAMSAIAAAAAASCIPNEHNGVGARGEERRDIIGGLLADERPLGVMTGFIPGRSHTTAPCVERISGKRFISASTTPFIPCGPCSFQLTRATSVSRSARTAAGKERARGSARGGEDGRNDRILPPERQQLGGGQAGGAPGGGGGGGGLANGHLSSMANLKSLLQLPVKGDQRAKDCCDMKDKDKPLDSDEDSLGGAGGGSCTLRPSSQSAFLGPLLWDRTLPCDGGLFQLQYMDLEEFLTENGMGCMHNSSSSSAQIPSQSSQCAIPNQSSQCPPSSPPPCSSSSVSSISSSSPSLLGLDVQQAAQGLLGAPEGLHGGQAIPPDPSASSSCPPPPVPPSTNATDVMVNFDPDPADLALSSVPGQEAFDPRRHRFTEEELKPQPMIKKARKMLVPDDQKDDKYWSRRYKNNEAAKRSRDARRLKENQISVRAAFLERENAALRQEVADMRKELGRCRNILHKYESRHGDL
ncbi:thyrotroph embryonic factor-like [Arapaima gigas]